jgi:hypothetical protein
VRRDPQSNKLLDEMVTAAIAKEGYPDHIKLAQKAYPKTVSRRRRELTISRMAEQFRSKLRRKLPKQSNQPIIPGLLGEAERP